MALFSKRSREGYLLVDNRAAGEGMQEFATVTCCGCQRVVVLNPQRTRERRYCRTCDHYKCDFCPPFDCVPMAKVLDELQNKALKHG